MFLNDINQISNIEWGKNHYWDCMFAPSAPPYNTLLPPPFPFTFWFPATEVEENLATITSQSIEGHLSSYQVPFRSTNQTIQLTFYDDANHTLAQWIADWINKDIFNNGLTVSPVSDIVRILVLVKYKIVGGKKVPVGSPSQSSSLPTAIPTTLPPLGTVLNVDLFGFNAYYVYPDTTLNFQGTSEAGTPQYTVQFMVAGKTSLPSLRTNKNFISRSSQFQNLKEGKTST